VVRSCVEVGIHKVVDLIPSPVGSDMMEVEFFRTIRKYVWEYCVVLVLCDLESAAEADKDFNLIVKNIVRFTRIVSFLSPAFLKCRDFVRINYTVVDRVS
jgi:hypothetical protein